MWLKVLIAELDRGVNSDHRGAEFIVLSESVIRQTPKETVSPWAVGLTRA